MSAMILACIVILGILAVTGLAFCAMRSEIGLKISASALRMFSISIEVASPVGNSVTGHRANRGDDTQSIDEHETTSIDTSKR